MSGTNEFIDVDFTKIFSEDGNRAEITVEDWLNGWVSIVHGNNGIPTAQQFNLFGYVLDKKVNKVYEMLNERHEAMKIYTSFADVDPSFTQDTSIVSVIRKMESKSILYTRVTSDTNRYPAETGTLRLEKYATDTAALMFDCLENGVPTKYFSYCTPDNIEIIFGGI